MYDRFTWNLSLYEITFMKSFQSFQKARHNENEESLCSTHHLTTNGVRRDDGQCCEEFVNSIFTETFKITSLRIKQ